ncbi:hypothetical protein MiSe_72570 [Microseira wollei NIES-4236]|uniref:Transposase n=1 Tax=Microseira wollei NIES-4236 TaxID=2530354 RepID=A0AAV3XKI9_9CYAN|nr:hypothetical protein MiSe_72570 [Microseira wollei NIES-4236]
MWDRYGKNQDSKKSVYSLTEIAQTNRVSGLVVLKSCLRKSKMSPLMRYASGTALKRLLRTAICLRYGAEAPTTNGDMPPVRR